MKTFRDIIAWQKSYQLTLKIYQYTGSFPKSEEFGLKSQIRRASLSIISNIAEGFKRTCLGDRLKFYNLAEASLEEVKCQTLLSHDLTYFTSEQFKELVFLEEESGRVLNGWIRSQSLQRLTP